MAAKIFRINYKSDFILTLNSDAGWMTPFCIKFWTGAPSQAYYVQWDGTTYTHCAYDPSEPTKLLVQFDDHHLPIGDLKFQIAYHFTVADFPNDTEDEVINPANITTEIDGETYQVMLDFTGETAPEIEFSLPAYANEAQRIANEQQRIAAETQRIANEESRISNEQTRVAQEQTRQQNEAQRIAQESARVSEFASLKSASESATSDANNAATLANEKAQLADDKAALADSAATQASLNAVYAHDEGQLAGQKAIEAAQATQLATNEAAFAHDQGNYAKNQGDYAKAQGDTALADHVRAEADHSTAAADHTTAGNDHTRAESDHSTSAADHITAGNDHTLAESDHTTAAADHTQAGQDHTTAASDHTQAGSDHTRAESDHTRAESDHAAVEVYVDSLGAFDISAYHATGGVLAEYADLTAALGTNGANVPESMRKGGMSVKFVQSSDNKYVQYRLMSDSWSIDTDNWAFSASSINSFLEDSDLDIADKEGNVIVKFEGGHIKTKNFDSSKISIDVTTSDKLLGEQDLVVSDEDGNAIVEFVGGGIKTKNFDSSKISLPKSRQSNLAFSVFNNWDKCTVNGWSKSGNIITSTAVGMSNSVINPNSYTNLNREIVCDFQLSSGVLYCGYMGINVPSSKSLLVSVDSAGNMNLHEKVATMGTIPAVVDTDTFTPVSHNHYRISIKNPTRGSVEIRLFDGYTLEELANIIKPFQYLVPSWGLSLAKPYFFSSVTGTIVTKFDVICHFVNDVKLLILGDSITQGYYSSAANNCYAALLTASVANSIAGGWSGGNYDVIMRSLDSEAPYIAPKYIMVTIGTNGGSTVETITAIIDKILELNSIPIINHVPMAGGDSAEVAQLANAAIDTAIAQYDEPIKCVKFDVATALNYDISQGRDSSLFTDDLHPNDNGHLRMFNQIKIDIPELFNN